MRMSTKSFSYYKEGKYLRGDDYAFAEIEEWFKEEQEGYADLGARNRDNYVYAYHAQNKHLGFSGITSHKPLSVLSIGGAYGDELLPIEKQVASVTIIEPSKQLRTDKFNGKPIKYIDPTVTGEIRIEDGQFDLITCFGVLHHIPNVSFVLAELGRVLKRGGLLLIREPIVSMGNWEARRGRLTKNERGIPLRLFREMIGKSNLSVKREQLCNVKPLDRIWSTVFRKSAYNSNTYVKLEKIAASLLAWKATEYHPVTVWQKCRPVAVFYQICKDV